MTSSITPLAAMNSTIDQMADRFNKVLPKEMQGKFSSVLKLTVSKNSKLLQADRMSLIQTFMDAATDGLYLDGREAAAVQYGQTINYLPMVEGIIKLMHNSGLIKTICAEVVYENDCFEYELGSNPHIKHIPLIVGDRGKRICVYCIVTTTNEGEYMEIMNMDEVNQCKKAARGSESPHSPWQKWFDQMAKKTVIHRIAKRLPKNDAINSVVRIEDELVKEPVDVTPKSSLSRLQESIGMKGADVEQAANDLLEKYSKEEK
tara:strand:- start:2119 stop:2901 length:783 start_codon:yes stop_codon:yes gene_type:complete